MKNTTLLFLVKKQDNKISELLFAMKKRGFGAGRWNGVGGKLSEGETIVQAVVRETKEEIGVDVQESHLKKVAELAFTFPHRPDFNQLVHVFYYGGLVR
jgi:8-oxo-dGTP diphosphatase